MLDGFKHKKLYFTFLALSTTHLPADASLSLGPSLKETRHSYTIAATTLSETLPCRPYFGFSVILMSAARHCLVSLQFSPPNSANRSAYRLRGNHPYTRAEIPNISVYNTIRSALSRSIQRALQRRQERQNTKHTEPAQNLKPEQAPLKLVHQSPMDHDHDHGCPRLATANGLGPSKYLSILTC